MNWFREKFGTVVVTAIIGFIAFVFVFYGVFNPRATRGLHEGAVAGTVNGDSISIAEFNRAFNQQAEFFRQMSGGKLSEEQIKQFHLRESVFQQLVRRKLMAQEAGRLGMVASDEEVKEKIQEMPVFQKDGRFDLPTYRQVLEANNYSPGTFERMMRDDLSVSQWESYFKARVHASEEEVRSEFLVSNDKRDVKYLVVTHDAGKKDVKVDDEAVKKFLADPAKLNIAKSQFEARKAKDFKTMTFEQARETLAREIIQGEKFDDVRKNSERIADQALGMLTADKAGDAKLNAAFKSYGLEVKSTGMITGKSGYVPGVGEAKDLMKDAFAAKSPIDAAHGGKAKKYAVAAGTVVALLVGAESPDLTKLEGQRESLIKQITSRKERELMEAFNKKLMEKAKIDPNPAVISGEPG
jgi:peptidyl-prolyl cis-trans isomerase D